MPAKLLAIDQGTSSTRAVLFDDSLRVAGIEQQEFPQIYPHPGWVEHDPEDIWQSTVSVVRRVLAKTGARARDVAALGIANQRETALLWERATGKPIHNAIVWQDRRTAEDCERLKTSGAETDIAAKTGLRLDPYFSATKIAWLLDHVPGARARAQKGEIAFGTVESFLIWRLTGGKLHVTDATNASRTLLYNLRSGQFDASLLEPFGIPASVLPEIRDCSGDFGVTQDALFDGAIRITGAAGDQQAAMIGQGCFAPGMMKSTYGTGAFMLLNTGDEPVFSRNRLLTTVAYQLGGKRAYALEGAIFIAGAAVKWLRDGLGIIASASETAQLAAAANPRERVYCVPAFVGLGAPYWDANARGALFGLTQASGAAELVRAVLESVAYQTRDLIEVMRLDWPAPAGEKMVFRVDGGMAANEWLMQFLADILDLAVEVPEILETTALGAAYLAGLASGICPAPEDFARSGTGMRKYEAHMDAPTRTEKYQGWRDAISRVTKNEAAGLNARRPDF
jgi:glycerol kinase